MHRGACRHDVTVVRDLAPAGGEVDDIKSKGGLSTAALIDVLGLIHIPEALARSHRHARHSLQLIDQ
jgi:hypothetical protein